MALFPCHPQFPIVIFIFIRRPFKPKWKWDTYSANGYHLDDGQDARPLHPVELSIRHLLKATEDSKGMGRCQKRNMKKKKAVVYTHLEKAKDYPGNQKK